MVDSKLVIEKFKQMIASLDVFDAERMTDVANASGDALPEEKKFLVELAKRRLHELQGVRALANYEMEKLADVPDRDAMRAWNGLIWLQNAALEISGELTSVLVEFNRVQSKKPSPN
jgi:hypothetical protein